MTVRALVLRVLSYLSTSLVFTVAAIIAGYSFFQSPKERMLQRELQQYELQYKLMDERLEQLQVVVADLADRDDNIYRIIFEAEPIPSAARKAGIGGSDRYVNMRGYKNSGILISAAQKVDKITAQLYVQSKSYDEVYAMAKDKASLLASIPAIQPISNNDLRRLSSYFGHRIDPFYKVSKFHEGVDFSAPTGTDIYSTGNGIVEQAGRSKAGYGNWVIIDHGFGYKTMYAHLQGFKVKRGERVIRGQVIATVGNTGKSTSPHLHYEVWKNNRPIDPINYFFNDITPEQYEEMVALSQRPSQSMD